MMSQTRHYQKAPITGAIIDLKVEPMSGLSASTLDPKQASFFY
jgi:hypothetical protein